MKATIRLRWATANMYVGNSKMALGIGRFLYWLRPWAPPHSIGIQEGSKYGWQLRTLALYRVENNSSKDAILRSNPTLIRRGLRKVHPHKSWRAAPGWRNEDDGKYGVHPPRTIEASFYEVRQNGGKVWVAHLNTHLHWIVDAMVEPGVRSQRPHEWPRILREYHDHVMLLKKIAVDYQFKGYQVVITADGNARPRTVHDWPYAIYNVFANLDWHIERNGVDVIIFSPARAHKEGARWAPMSVTGSDDHEAGAVRVDRVVAT